MYVPPFNAVEDESAIRAMVAGIGTAEFVTTDGDGYPIATLVPILWHDQTVIAHLAKANGHWREIADQQPALLICTGPQAYISPSWYAAKAEHGRVVPTWNYSSVHLSGAVTVHDDAEWLRNAVTLLTQRHEHTRTPPWQVTDAPPDYIAGQLRGIVGVEITVDRVEAKAKLSQNRSAQDRAGVIAGLSTAGHPEVASDMQQTL